MVRISELIKRMKCELVKIFCIKVSGCVTNLNIILHVEIVDDEWVVKIGILDGFVQWEALRVK
jgi:hypothetical protein